MPMTPEEEAVRQALLATMPQTLAPSFLRMAFHDAGTYDVQTHTGGADGSIHFASERSRSENTSLGPCLDLLTRVKMQFPQVSWADLIALAGAVAVEACHGPRIPVGMGRVDALQPDHAGRLPSAQDDPATLKGHFHAMGLSLQDLVALSGGHTLGGSPERPFTPDRYTFSNSYFQCLLQDVRNTALLDLLGTDHELVEDPELRPYVERYASDEQRFFDEFSEAYQKLVWLGQSKPAPEC